MSIVNRSAAACSRRRAHGDWSELHELFAWLGIHIDSGSCFFNPFRCVWPYSSRIKLWPRSCGSSAQQPGVGSIDIAVSPSTNRIRRTIELHFDIEVLPKVDLAVTVDPAGLSLHPGESGTVHVDDHQSRRDAGHERKSASPGSPKHGARRLRARTMRLERQHVCSSATTALSETWVRAASSDST